MTKKISAFSFLFLVGLLGACSTTPRQTARAQGGDVVHYAKSLIGTPYHYGGTSPRTGFDCSGFVDYVFLKARGIDLPRRAEDMSHVGVRIKGNQLRPGDLVFFSSQGWPYSHVGIYIGDAKFIHSPHTGSRVEIVNMGQRYWQAHYNGARRVLSRR